MTVLIHIGFRGFRFQRDHIKYIGYPHPFIIKILILHSILQTILLQMLNGILSLRLIPLTDISQLGSGKGNLDKQTFHQRTVQFKQFFVLFVIVCYFLFGDLARQFLAD